MANPSLTLRFLRPGDQSEVKSLCERWFPLEYSPSWYDEIVDEENYFALAACHCLTERIIGLLVARLVPLRTSSHYDQKILCRSFLAEGTACYILVLGVADAHRRQGVAALLLEHLSEYVDRHPTCFAIYLHVLQSNRSAIEFYRSQRFQCRQHLRRFYAIEKEFFDAFCFVRYVHSKTARLRPRSSVRIFRLDGYPPRTLNDLLISVQSTVWGRKFVQLLIRVKEILLHLCFSDR